MAIHYNAFISYRHHPEDIRVATQIQRALERFRVPKALRGKVKLPLRLFRDKDELPITSNLTSDIFEALENSDFLIVICSVHTKESLWVQREIETFLKTHSRDKVLTVLVNGEPYDVIPEILLHEEVKDPVTGEVTRVPMEPLSCDWRTGHRKAMREELPRLAAALLHCGYDELRQRQKQYRMRQLIAVFSVALTASLALTAYFLYTTITIRNANIQIQKNLDQALRNQSQHLGTAAETKLEEGDRLTAIALLLEAMPSETNPRPYIPDLEYILTNALGVYSGEYEMAAQAALIPGGATIVNMMVTDEKDIIYLQDSRSIVTGWNIETMQRQVSIDPHGVIDKLVGTTPEGGILLKVVTNNSLHCYSREGKRNWQLDRIYSARMSEDGSQVYVLRGGDTDTRLLEIYAVDSGSVLKSLVLEKQGGELPYAFVSDRIREDVPIPIEFSGSDSMIGLLDPVTGEWTPLMTTEYLIRATCILENGNYLFMAGDGTGEMNGIFGRMNTTSPMGSDIFCFAPDGKLLWQSKITTYTYTSTHTLRPVPDTPWIFCQTGDTLQLILRKTGEVVQTCGATSSVVTMIDVTSDYAMGFLEDGCIFDYQFATNECNALDYNMEGDLRMGAVGRGFFTLAWDSGQVTFYNFNDVMSQWEIPMEENVVFSKFRQRGSEMALQISSELCLVDMQTRSFRWRIPRNDLDLLDYSVDGNRIWATGVTSELVSIDAATGKLTEYPVEWKREDRYLGYITDFVQAGDLFYFLAKDGRTMVLCCVEPLSGQMQFYDVFSADEVEIPYDLEAIADSTYLLEDYIQSASSTEEEMRSAAESVLAALQVFENQINSSSVIHIQGNFAWVLDSDGNVYCVDMAAGKSEIVLTGLEERPPIAVRESDGAIAIAAGTELLLYLPDAPEPICTTLDNEQIGSLCFREEGLLAVTDTGYLQRFDMALQPLERVGLTVSYSFNTDLFSKYADIRSITWQFGPDNKLYLNLFQVMNIIDCEYWGCTAYVPNCMMYDMNLDLFLCGSNNRIRTYPNYDTQGLMALAREALGSFALTEQQRQAYGLES